MLTHTDWSPPSDLILTYNNNLSEEFCNHVIDCFENDARKSEGITQSGVDKTVKDSVDLYFTDLKGWEAEDVIFHNALKEPAQDAFTILSEFRHYPYDPRDTGFQVQRTDPSGGYIWHNDSHVYTDRYERVYTYIWYLNTVDGGGETEFADRKIKPEVGKLVLFPATWNYIHRGLPPKEGLKYICTGWLLSGPFIG